MRRATGGTGALLLAATLTACSPAHEADPGGAAVLPDMETAAEVTTGEGTRTATPRVADIVSAPEQFADRTVTLEAAVAWVFGPRAFSVDDDVALAAGVDPDLLVLSRQAGGGEAVDEASRGNRVRVTGSVGRTAVVELEKELGWDLNADLEAEVEGARVVLIADSVTRVED